MIFDQLLPVNHVKIGRPTILFIVSLTTLIVLNCLLLVTASHHNCDCGCGCNCEKKKCCKKEVHHHHSHEGKKVHHKHGHDHGHKHSHQHANNHDHHHTHEGHSQDHHNGNGFTNQDVIYQTKKGGKLLNKGVIGQISAMLNHLLANGQTENGHRTLGGTTNNNLYHYVQAGVPSVQQQPQQQHQQQQQQQQLYQQLPTQVYSYVVQHPGVTGMVQNVPLGQILSSSGVFFI